MVRSPEINHGLKKGPWTPEEDHKLRDYIQKHGHGSWQSLPERAGLNRCGKSCRLRWTNYLRPDIKRGHFSPEEDQTIIDLHSTLGNKWAMIAARLPGRTDNEIKNYWNTHLRKKLLRAGIDPKTHQLVTDLSLLSSFNNFPMSLVDVRLLENILRLLNSNPLPSFLVNPLYPNMENGGLSGDYSPVTNAFRPEEMDVINTEFCLPGLIPATAGDKNVESRSVHDYSPSPVVENYEGWGAAANDEAGGSFWKDIFYESFPSSSL